jgi:hypothetical protein
MASATDLIANGPGTEVCANHFPLLVQRRSIVGGLPVLLMATLGWAFSIRMYSLPDGT